MAILLSSRQKLENWPRAKAIGISTANTTANLADMNFALVLRADNKYEIFVGNVSQFVSSGSYTTALGI
jgi:hypothetical protein